MHTPSYAVFLAAIFHITCTSQACRAGMQGHCIRIYQGVPGQHLHATLAALECIRGTLLQLEPQQLDAWIFTLLQSTARAARCLDIQSCKHCMALNVDMCVMRPHSPAPGCTVSRFVVCLPAAS